MGFSVTSILRSGRNAIAQGLLNPEAISVTLNGVRVWMAGARVCPGKAGVNSGTLGGAVSTGAPCGRGAAAASRTRGIAAIVREGCMGVGYPCWDSALRRSPATRWVGVSL